MKRNLLDTYEELAMLAFKTDTIATDNLLISAITTLRSELREVQRSMAEFIYGDEMPRSPVIYEADLERAEADLERAINLLERIRSMGRCR